MSLRFVISLFFLASVLVFSVAATPAEEIRLVHPAAPADSSVVHSNDVLPNDLNLNSNWVDSQQQSHLSPQRPSTSESVEHATSTSVNLFTMPHAQEVEPVDAEEDAAWMTVAEGGSNDKSGDTFSTTQRGDSDRRRAVPPAVRNPANRNPAGGRVDRRVNRRTDRRVDREFGRVPRGGRDFPRGRDEFRRGRDIDRRRFPRGRRWPGRYPPFYPPLYPEYSEEEIIVQRPPRIIVVQPVQPEVVEVEVVPELSVPIVTSIITTEPILTTAQPTTTVLTTPPGALINVPAENVDVDFEVEFDD